MRVLRWTAALIAVSGLMSLAPAADDKAEPKLSKEEQLLVDLTNKARAKEKLPEVKVNALLMKAAQGHSANMAKQHKLTHELDGKRVKDRLDDLKYDWELCGENVGNLNNLKLLQGLFDSWMKSPEHRKNILQKEFDEIGIALVHDPKGNLYYVTQVFGTQGK